MNHTIKFAAVIALSWIACWTREAAAQVEAGPDTVLVKSGQLTLRGLLWRPTGAGPFPGVLFNHGSGSTADPVSMEEASTIGRLFARHGYVFLFLFRQGMGLSRGQGTADGDLMARAFAAEGVAGRNRVQLELLEGDELGEATCWPEIPSKPSQDRLQARRRGWTLIRRINHARSRCSGHDHSRSGGFRPRRVGHSRLGF